MLVAIACPAWVDANTMNKTKLIALCGICGAVAVICLVALSYVKWVALALAVIASVVVCCPQMIDGKYVAYSIASYLVATVIALFVGNVVYVAPVAIFAMPCAIWKLVCKHNRCKNARLWAFFKWLLNVVLMAIATLVTALLMREMMPSLWQSFVQNKTMVLLVIGALLLSIVAYDKLLDGAIYVVENALKKSKFGQ